MATAVAKREEAGLPSADVLDIFAGHEGEGLDYDSSELQIPFVRLIQALSPQVKKSDSGVYPRSCARGHLQHCDWSTAGRAKKALLSSRAIRKPNT
jgi:hypothetical protein